ncbi:MAG: hypothetical protein N3A59_07135 [Thermodesulfovibrionales bacterium]|nr:hypothetical protein [Thermodesulfovibrionales bacterium]
MIDKLIKIKNKDYSKKPDFISYQLTEAQEIADLLIEKIESKIKTLKQLEAEIDKKILILEKLLQKTKTIKIPSLRSDNYDEIIFLTNKGFTPPEISNLLDIPIGEVELFLNLRRKEVK